GFTMNGLPGQQSRLVALGDAAHPVTIGSDTPGQRWSFIRGYSPDSIVELAYTTVEDGGNGTYAGTELMLRGAGNNEVSPVLKADHLTLDGAKGVALVLE